MCRVEGADYFEVSRVEERTARKEHVCGDCLRVIEPGERYIYATGLYEGAWYPHKLCAHCQWAAAWLNAECGGFLYTEIREELEEHWAESPLYRTLDLGRRIIGMRRKWRDRQGNLMPVPG